MPLIYVALPSIILPLLLFSMTLVEVCAMFVTAGGSFLLPAQVCPACGYVLNAAREVVPPGEEATGPPVPGDETVCWGCAVVLVVDARGTLREQPLREVSASALEAQAHVTAYKRRA
jgi:hypothetical protein